MHASTILGGSETGANVRMLAHAAGVPVPSALSWSRIGQTCEHAERRVEGATNVRTRPRSWL